MSKQVCQLAGDAVQAAIEGADVPVLIDFGAPWCLPCRRQQPVTEQVARRMGRRARVCMVDIDGNRSLAARLNIHSIPTLIVFFRAVERERFVGIQSPETLVNVLKRWGRQAAPADTHREA
ncbi:MAG TPA: thioredoxin [Desulfobacteraceae bacterium]|nr:thioredoxin family protein [Deltaproteobacteria bacterium]MBW2355400.1 thioredoxin family protein [Deltaproteobacteria bacterium]RLB97661.1 MAG: thiol reductase thioredoxin [Deltaproteobacteria bacterium]HDI60142.1 thioredoxin [Desulfobacteraceae bacterium]